MWARKAYLIAVAVGAGALAIPAQAPVAQAQQLMPCPQGFVRIPSGTFMMGSAPGDGEADEHPAHPVTVPGFCMERLEVTVAEYEACMLAGVCSPTGMDTQCNMTAAHRPARSNHPVNCVDFAQAMTFCAYIGARLPTEPEWEFAARGTDGRRYPWGNTPPGRSS